MYRPLIIIALLIVCSACSHAQHQDRDSPDDGLKSVTSTHSVSVTADKLVSILRKKGLTVFARIDHASNATKVSMDLRPTQLIIFGKPQVGTKLMQCNQSVGIDLPQKMLIWEDDKGISRITYNDPDYLKNRHGLRECKVIIEKISGILANLAGAASN